VNKISPIKLTSSIWIRGKPKSTKQDLLNPFFLAKQSIIDKERQSKINNDCKKEDKIWMRYITSKNLLNHEVSKVTVYRMIKTAKFPPLNLANHGGLTKALLTIYSQKMEIQNNIKQQYKL
jgi:hypothetical protein